MSEPTKPAAVVPFPVDQADAGAAAGPREEPTEVRPFTKEQLQKLASDSFQLGWKAGTAEIAFMLEAGFRQSFGQGLKPRDMVLELVPLMQVVKQLHEKPKSPQVEWKKLAEAAASQETAAAPPAAPPRLRITIEATEALVNLEGTMCRLWEGTLPSGGRVKVFVLRVAAPEGDERSCAELEKALKEQLPPGHAVLLREVLT